MSASTTHPEDKKGQGEGSERERLGPYHGKAFLLEIDPDSLPDTDWQSELKRRHEMYLRGEDGWRTGERGGGE